MLTPDELRDKLANDEVREWLINNYQEELSEMIESNLESTWLDLIMSGLTGGKGDVPPGLDSSPQAFSCRHPVKESE